MEGTLRQLTDRIEGLASAVDRVPQAIEVLQSQLQGSVSMLQSRLDGVERRQEKCDDTSDAHGKKIAALEVHAASNAKDIDRLQKSPRESRAERTRREGPPADEQTGPPIQLMPPARRSLWDWFLQLSPGAQALAIGGAITAGGGLGSGIAGFFKWVWALLQAAAAAGRPPGGGAGP